MTLTAFRLEHWAAAFALFVVSVIVWTIVAHYTEKWIAVVDGG